MTTRAIATTTTTAATQYHDDLGRVFDRMQIQRGESFDFTFGRKHGADDWVWEWYSHIEFDGIGVLIDIARRHGHDLAVPQLKIRRDRRASFVEYLKPFLRPGYLRAAPRWSWDAKPPAGPPERRLPQVGVYFSERETREITEHARRLGVTVNSLVLWALADALRPYAARPDDPQYWTLPINMRGGVDMPAGAANVISFIRIPVRPRDTPAVIHARTYELLTTGMHWVMLRWITFFANRSTAKFPPVRSTGCLSNLGSHVVPGGPDRVTFTPPPGTTEPIAVGLLSWNGVMSVALSVHRSLNPPPGALDELALRLRDRILSGPP